MPEPLLKDRHDDIEAAVAEASAVLRDSAAQREDGGGWRVTSVEAKFGITLGAEAGVILSKASAEASRAQLSPEARMSSLHLVRIHRDDACLGAGFFIMPRRVLTARHCLGNLQEEDRVDLHCADGTVREGRLYHRPPGVDLALIETIEPVDPPLEERWTNPYHLEDDGLLLSGKITHLLESYRCADGGSVEALQLSCEQAIGSYAGYSGSPIEREDTKEDTKGAEVLGILLEQYPDRETPGRAAPVLIAATMKDALKRFDCFRVGHLVDVLDPGGTGPIEPGAKSEQLDGAQDVINMLIMPVGKELLKRREARRLWLRLAKSIIKARISETKR